MIAAVALLLLTQDRPSPEWTPVVHAPANLNHVLTIPPNEHPGPRLEISGRVLKADRRTPVAAVTLYFHHTDGSGVYRRPRGSNPRQWVYWHGSLRGWLKTDAQGRYSLRTTRPAPYPRGREPAHIHVYGLLPGARRGINLPAIVFQGDPYLDAAYWRMNPDEHGYRGTRLQPDRKGVLHGEMDFILPRS